MPGLWPFGRGRSARTAGGEAPRRASNPRRSSVSSEALLREREERIRDLGGLVFEMFRRDRFRVQLVTERCADLVALEKRLEVGSLLSSARRGGPRCECGPRLPGAPTSAATAGARSGPRPVVACARCGTLSTGVKFCGSCGSRSSSRNRLRRTRRRSRPPSNRRRPSAEKHGGPCPRCGTATEPHQEYCLECGLRLRTPGLVPALSEGWRRRVTWYPGDWIWPSLAALVVAVIAASAAIVWTRDAQAPRARRWSATRRSSRRRGDDRADDSALPDSSDDDPGAAPAAAAATASDRVAARAKRLDAGARVAPPPPSARPPSRRLVELCRRATAGRRDRFFPLFEPASGVLRGVQRRLRLALGGADSRLEGGQTPATATRTPGV